jgi:hypothetical protein
LGSDEKVIVKSVHVSVQENRDLSIFIPIAVPVTIEDTRNDKIVQDHYEKLLTSISSSEIDSPSSPHRDELDALFKSYYSATKLSASDHLRYCTANRHEIYIAPATEKRPDSNYEEIKHSFIALSRPATESCSLLEKKVLPFGAIHVDEAELKRLGVLPDVDYIMYLMVFSRDSEKPLLLAGPYHNVLVVTNSGMMSAVSNKVAPVSKVPTTILVAGFCLVVLSSLLAVVGYAMHQNLQEKTVTA